MDWVEIGVAASELPEHMLQARKKCNSNQILMLMFVFNVLIKGEGSTQCASWLSDY